MYHGVATWFIQLIALTVFTFFQENIQTIQILLKKYGKYQYVIHHSTCCKPGNTIYLFIIYNIVAFCLIRLMIIVCLGWPLQTD